MRGPISRSHNRRLAAWAGAVSLAGSVAGAARAEEFETFSLPRPEPLPAAGATVRSAAGARSAQLPVGRARYQPPKLRDHLNARVQLLLFPGRHELTLASSGEIAGRRVDTYLNPGEWLRGNLSNPGYLQLARNGRGLQLGGASSALLGNAQGFRFFAPVAAGRASLGVGLYQRLRDVVESDALVPAADLHWKPNPEWEGGLLLAVDRSFRVMQEGKVAGWKFAGFAGRDAARSRLEGGLSLEGQIAPRAAFFGRALGWSGDRRALSLSGSLLYRAGPAILSLDHGLTRAGDGQHRLTSAGFLLPQGARFYSLRWSRSAQENRGSASRTTDLLAASVVAPLGTRSTVRAGATHLRSSDGAPATFLSFGGSRAIGDRWDVQAEVYYALPSAAQAARHTLQVSVGYQLDADWQFRLLYGPTLELERNGLPRHAFGVGIVRALRFQRAEKTAEIRGAVQLDGRPYSNGIPVRIDGQPVVRTDAQGRFRIGGVPAGTYRVDLQLTALPASIGGDAVVHTVQARPGRAEEVVFSLRRMVQVRGRVVVVDNGLGASDPTAAVGVVVQTEGGPSTSTNRDGEFILGGLAPGRHRVVLVPSTIPPDFEVVGAAEVEVEALLDAAAPVVEFRIAPRRRKIEFGDPEP